MLCCQCLFKNNVWSTACVCPENIKVIWLSRTPFYVFLLHLIIYFLQKLSYFTGNMRQMFVKMLQIIIYQQRVRVVRPRRRR